MFAITGALFATSFRKHGLTLTLRRRFSRLFPPLWLYCAVVLALSTRLNLSTSSLWTFFLPLDQPTSAIASEWFTSALWYVRAYLWILLLSPILFILVRKFGTIIPIVGCLVVLCMALLAVDESGLGWVIGDVFLYSTCATAGMAWLHQHEIRRTSLVTIGACSIAAVFIWVANRPLTSNVVNNDHVLHLLLGAFWLSLLLTIPSLLSKFSSTRLAQFLNQYPLSIYLWHSMVAWFFWQITADWYPSSIRAISITFATLASLPAITFLVGQLEKNTRLITQPSFIAPRFAVSGVILLALTLLPIDLKISLVRDSINQPLPPSAAPKITKVVVDEEISRLVDSSSFTSYGWDEKTTKLQDILERYDKKMNLKGTRAVVISPAGDVWRGKTANARPFEEPSLIGSLTKTFTTTLIMRLVEQGKLELDAPIGDLGIKFSHSQVTPRQLLSQSSGMPKFSTQSGSVPQGTTVKDVLGYISAQSLRFKPGTDIDYSTTGFVVLGALLEKITGQTFEELIRQEIALPLGYKMSTFIGNYGSVGFATGGISMRMDDLADWSRRYFFRQNTTEEEWQWSIRRTTGLGVHGYCPCESGNFMALGHIGGRTFASVDGDGTVVVIDTRGVLVLDNYKTTQSFAHELRLVAGGGTKFLYRK
jgi:CubicO group peptidase (beta-lactamase class C family)/peptidoglycan/LPS O-acetylase OafA/YrhL